MADGARDRWLAGALVLLALAAYAVPLLDAGWIWDDDMYVLNNRTLRSLSGLAAIWLEPRSLPQYYPLVHTTFWIEHHLFGTNPVPYHLDNLALHAGSAILLFLLLRRLAVPGAWFAAAVFAVHPVQVESVAWVTERKNVLSAFLYLGAALSFVRFFRLAGTGEERLGPPRAYALGAALYLGALLSKTVTASLPAALLLLVWWKRERLLARAALLLSPLFATGALLGLTTAWLEKHHVGAQGEAWDLTFLERCLVAGRALWFYLGKLVWPAELTFVYPRFAIDASDAAAYLFPLAALVALGALLAASRRIGRGPAVAALFFCGTLLPALGFFNVFPMRYSFVADHFQYLASVGAIAGLAAAGAFATRTRPALARALGSLLLALLVALTFRQTRIYRDLETLWRDTLAKNPGAWMAHTNLGLLLVHRGAVAEGMEHYRAAIELAPQVIEPRLDLGEVLQREGRPDEAIVLLLQTVERFPTSAVARFNLGTAFAKQGRYDEAIAALQEAVRLDPRLEEAEYNLGTALLKLSRNDEAERHLARAVALRPDYAAAHANLARVLEILGRTDDARLHRDAAARLKEAAP